MLPYWSLRPKKGESEIDAEELLSTGGTVGDLVRLLHEELG